MLPEVTDALKKNLGDDDNLFVEAAAVVATYNMVSRFLVSLDVGGGSDDLVPWPADEQEVLSYLTSLLTMLTPLGL